MHTPTPPPRFRFAPSPTGFLHVGGARTALFNFLAARKLGGKFLLRIEDTDLLRSKPEFTANIQDALAWLELRTDQPIVVQSERTERYAAVVDQLLSSGIAYRCTCSPEELETRRAAALAVGKKPKYDGSCRKGPLHPDRPSCVRVRFPDQGIVRFNDLFRGPITFNVEELDDLIIQRTDGGYAYNFVVVVDDAAMQISHVLRGDDHINNTPRQLILYDLLGLELPQFGHLPMILGPDKKRLSKRDAATAVTDYRSQGYLPSALVNFLVRLGWSHGDEELFFSIDELIEKFSFDAVGRSPAVFDITKLRWINEQHLRRLPPGKLLDFVDPARRSEPSSSLRDRIMQEIAARSSTTLDIASGFQNIAEDPAEYDAEAVRKWISQGNIPILKATLAALESLTSWTESSIQACIEERAKQGNVKLSAIAQPLRIWTTGTAASPGLFLIFEYLGRERVLSRLRRGLERATAPV